MTASDSTSIAFEEPSRDKNHLMRAGAWKLPAPGNAGRPQNTPPPQREAPHVPGDFTQMFQAPAPPVTQPLPATPVNSPDAIATVSLPQFEPPAGQGEFTRIFRAAPAQASTEGPIAPPSVAPVTGPGEFTRVFRAEKSTHSAGSAPQTSEPAEQSGFTRMFQSPASPPAQSPAVPPATPPLAAPDISPQSDQGEFTRLFRAETMTKPEPAKAPRLDEPAEQGGFTRMFESPAAGRTTEPPPIASPLPIPPVAARPPLKPALPAQAGDFTRMFQSPASAAPPDRQTVESAQAFGPHSPVGSGASPTGATGAFGGAKAPSPAGQSEFTRMISVQPAQSIAPVPQNPPAPPSIAKKGVNITLLVAIFEGLIILVLALVLFFYIKK